MKDKEWIITERKRLRRGFKEIKNQKKNIWRKLPYTLLLDKIEESKNLAKDLEALRINEYTVNQRIGLLSKILRDDNNE